VKTEPCPSPYLNYPGNYRDPAQTTPSPQPTPTTPIIFNNTILHHQLQAPRATLMAQNDFQQQSQVNQIYTPNITMNIPFSNGSTVWANATLNGNEPSTSRFNNVQPASAIFNQPLTPLMPNPTQTQTNYEPMTNSSILIDLDNQILNNLSGDLNNLSFSDFGMESAPSFTRKN
jgi:hypothetical protein